MPEVDEVGLEPHEYVPPPDWWANKDKCAAVIASLGLWRELCSKPPEHPIHTPTDKP